METIKIDQDIKVMYIAASSFPDGALAAHQQLHSLIPFTTDRKYFGVSRPENGAIAYKAAAEEKQAGEAEKLNLETLVIKKGNYISLIIHDYVKDIPAIEKTFSQLISQPGIDPQGYCVEEYITQNDMLCMVRLND
jgi:hypothetical protein